MKAVQKQWRYNVRFMLKSISLIYCYLSLKSTVGCPSPINYTVPDITNNDVSYTATGLNPYTLYVVKVVAINGVGEGRPVNEIVRTDEEGTKLQFLSWNFEIHSVQIHAIILKNVPKTVFFLNYFTYFLHYFDEISDMLYLICHKQLDIWSIFSLIMAWFPFWFQCNCEK